MKRISDPLRDGDKTVCSVFSVLFCGEINPYAGMKKDHHEFEEMFE